MSSLQEHANECSVLKGSVLYILFEICSFCYVFFIKQLLLILYNHDPPVKLPVSPASIVVIGDLDTDHPVRQKVFVIPNKYFLMLSIQCGFPAFLL
jgi:hypothetical protein